MFTRDVSIQIQGATYRINVSIGIGSDEWIVYLHGLQTNKHLYQRVFGPTYMNSYSKLTIDLLGFGESDHPEDFSYRVQDQAQIVRQILDQLEIERVHLVGHSLGGMVGILLIEPLQQRLVSLSNLEGNMVLADCGLSMQVIGYTYENFESKGYEQICKQIATAPDPSAPMRSQWLSHTPARTIYYTSQSIVQSALEGSLLDLFNQADLPRLYLYGDRDAHKIPSISDRVVKVAIPEAGHFMILEQPQASYHALQRFITGLAR